MSRSTPIKPDLTASIATFGDLLRYLRQRAHLTQREMAIAVGYSISQISRLEQNERLPDEMTLLAVFVPALGLEQEQETVKQLLLLARQAREGVAVHTERDTERYTKQNEARDEPASPPPVAAPVARQASPPLSNLPHRLTSLIGREQAVIDLQAWAKSHRLVTLTGVGGVGKSSLALTVAHTLMLDNPLFPDGIWLLELATFTTGESVARLLADLFQLPEFSGRTHLDVVSHYLQHKRLLLILDNCEHLISACADLVDHLLRASATLHILATSREPLNINGEYEWPVLPLSTPTDSSIDLSSCSFCSFCSLQQLQPFTSAQLFIERAQAIKSNLRFSDHDAPLIATICQQVDGIPLALELAAARCKSLSLYEMVTRLQDRFALLTAGRRTALPRHQTLQATIDWSYDLLTPAEAALFRALSVFAGSWTAEAAEAIVKQEADQLSSFEPSTFDLLHQLVNKSLVIVDPDGKTTRYRMLETIRHYASERLQEEGECEVVRARHFAYFLSLAQKSSLNSRVGVRLEQGFNQIKADLENLRVAFAWSQSQQDGGESSLQLVTALGLFWQLQKNVHEGRLWLEETLARADPAHAELYSWGIVWLALTLLYATPRSFDLASEALQRFTVLNQPDGIALANLLLGIWAVARRDTDKAIDHLQQARLQFEAKETHYLLGRTYFYLADTFALLEETEQALDFYQRTLQLSADSEGYPAFRWVWESMAVIDPQQAITLCQQQVVRQRQLQNQAKVAGLLQTLGHILTIAKHLPAALSALNESLTLWQRVGIDWNRGGGASRVYLDLALVHYLGQEYQQAMQAAQQAIRIYQAVGDLHRLAYAYVSLGYSALATPDFPLARTTFLQSIQAVAEQETHSTYMAIAGLAEIARHQQSPAFAARLFGITDRFVERPKPIEDRLKEMYYQPLLATGYANLRQGRYASAWVEGQTMNVEQAIRIALTFASSGMPPSND